MPEISSVFVIAFVVLFLHATSWYGMINYWIHKVAYSWPSWIKKPLFDCPICMSPWWGSLILLLYGLVYDQWVRPFDWVLTVFAAGGINTVLIYMVASDKEEIKNDN